MDYCQYMFACPTCGSDVELISIECNPIIVQCFGCNRIVVAQGGHLYTVSKEFFKTILEEFDMVNCGQVTNFKIRRQDPENSPFNKKVKKGPITKEDIQAFRVILNDSSDPLELIKKMG